MQLVGDYYNTLAVVAHFAQHIEKLFGLLRGEHRRGFVKYQNIRAAVKHLDDLDSLLFRNGHIVYLFLRVYFKAIGIRDRAYLFFGFGNAEPALFLYTENDIFGGGKNVHKLEVLVDHADPERKSILWGAYDRFLTIHEYFTRIRKINTGYHIHKRGFSASVFAQNRKYLTLVSGETYIVVCNRFSEAFAYIFKLDRRGLTHSLPSPLRFSESSAEPSAPHSENRKSKIRQGGALLSRLARCNVSS